MRLLVVVSAGVALLASCDRDKPTPPPVRDPSPPRRIIEPPMTGIVRQLPPHAIRSDGVGPYIIGDKVAALLQQLPSGPRIMRFEIPGIVRTSVIRAEDDDTIVIGGETASAVTFVAVVGGSEVARTEKSNVHVGSSLADLERALGPFVEDPDRARDPRLVIPSQQRNLRVVVEDDRIATIVVTSDATAARPQPESTCMRPAPPASADPRHRFSACLTTTGELVDVEGEEVTVRSANGESKIASIKIPNLVFAQALRPVGEARDEIVAITSTEDPQERRWSLSAYRLEGTRLVRSVDNELLYEMTNARTRWIGAELRDVQLYLELTSQSDGIEVGGLLTTQSGAKLRDVAVISPVRVSRQVPIKTSGKPVGPDASSGAAVGGAGSGAGSGTRSDAGSAIP